MKKSKKHPQPEEGGLREKDTRDLLSNAVCSNSTENDICKKFVETKASNNISKCDKIISPDDDSIMNNCWRMSIDEASIKLLDLFKKSYLEEDEDKKPLEREAKEFLPPYTQEFQELMEVQNKKILRTVEHMMKKLANEDSTYETRESNDGQIPSGSNNFETGRFSSRKFLLTWVMIKIVEMVRFRNLN